MQAQKWVELRLRDFDGPKPRQTAVLVVNVRPSDEDPEAGYVMVSCLPDMDVEPLIAGLEQWIVGVKTGQLRQEPHGLDETPDPTRQ
jgi:hypothetical protein